MKKKTFFLGGIALALVSLFGFYTYTTTLYCTSVCRKCMLQKTETWLYEKLIVRTSYQGTLVHDAFFKLTAYDHPCQHEWGGGVSGGPYIKGGSAGQILRTSDSVDVVVFLAIIQQFFPQEKELWFSRLDDPEFFDAAGYAFISLDDGESLQKWHAEVVRIYEELKKTHNGSRKKP